MPHHTRTLTAITAILITTTALAGCGTTTTGTTRTECSNTDGGAATCTITMPDTRRVTCIAYKGLSCDWDHADGADKLGGTQ